MRTNTEVLAIFTALALGYALPYALIEMFPQALHQILPKPGAWMQKIKIILSIPILLTAVWLGSIWYTQVQTDTYAADTTELDWQPFDAEKIAELNEQGRNIFVDFTADWCLTCQFNERFILKSQNFKDFVKENDVALFVADLTEHQEDFGIALSSYGRDAIPLYVYYHEGNYRILPLFFRVNSLKQ
jgi:thiol:disulfide interchange protein DsbD